MEPPDDDRGPGSIGIDPAETAALAAARSRVLERIEGASRRVGRDARGVELIAVSKTVAVERLRAAVAAGFTTFGENRVQEGARKAPFLPDTIWHLIGPLQSNKARRAVDAFDWIQTVDSTDLAGRVDRLVAEQRPGRPLPVLLQVNVDVDPAKSGFAPAALTAALPLLAEHRDLDLRGLMTVGRLVTDPADARPTFVALRRLSERLRRDWPSLGPELSMGMSADFEVAVEEGATMVRVGQALFGARAYPGG